jgi:hypothetical protein
MSNFLDKSEEKYSDSVHVIEESQSIVPNIYSQDTDGDDEIINFISNEPDGSGFLVPTKIEHKREQTRGHLATIFILGFFFMLASGGLFIALSGDSTEIKVKLLQDVFLVISGVLSGPLGFVVGYYFRKQEEEEN